MVVLCVEHVIQEENFLNLEKSKQVKLDVSSWALKSKR